MSPGSLINIDRIQRDNRLEVCELCRYAYTGFDIWKVTALLTDALKGDLRIKDSDDETW